MKSSPQSRPGSVYLVVLSTTVLVTSIALLGLESQRSTARSVDLLISSAKARTLSQSGFEIALQTLASQDWRSKLTSGSTVVSVDDGSGGLIKVAISDPVDADLADDPWDDVQLTSSAWHGSASSALQVRLKHAITPDPALSYCLFSRGGIKFKTCTFSSSAPVYADVSFYSDKSTVDAPVQSSTSIAGITYLRTQTANSEVKSAVTYANLLSIYGTQATPIVLSTISSRKIERVALGPGVNPYGTKVVNPRGIYFIDCGGSDLTVSRARISGTLVLKNCRKLTIERSVCWEPAETNLPVFILDGELDVDLDATDLLELTNLVNFNPAGAPFKSVSDIDTLDAYPSLLGGVSYTAGAARLRNKACITGTMICDGLLEVEQDPRSTYSNIYKLNPPEGFRTPGALKISSIAAGSASK